MRTAGNDVSPFVPASRLLHSLNLELHPELRLRARMLLQDIIDLHCQCVDELHHHYRYYGMPDYQYALLVSTMVTAARKFTRRRDILPADQEAVATAVYQHGFKKWLKTCRSRYASEEEFLASMPDPPDDHFAYMYKHGHPRRTKRRQ